MNCYENLYGDKHLLITYCVWTYIVEDVHRIDMQSHETVWW
jgi:hypothetical protein